MAKKSNITDGVVEAWQAHYDAMDVRPYPRVQKHFYKPSKTRASEMASTDLKSLVHRFRLAGALPPNALSFGDTTVLPKDRMELFERIQDAVGEAKTAFDALPLKVRQAVNHNPANLEAWVESNPELAREWLVGPAPVVSSPVKPTSSGGAGEGEKGDPA